MYVVLTANYDAGILQLAKQIKKTLAEIDDVTLFVPTESKTEGRGIEQYDRVNSIAPYCHYYEIIAKKINALHPAIVFSCESNLITSRIILNLNKDIRVVMCVHDVNPHPSYGSIKAAIKESVKKPYVKQAWKRANTILLLSENSKNKYVDLYPSLTSKVNVLKLGAHVPDVPTKMPPELTGKEQSFILFFGRIDKYKGLYRLLRAFSKVQEQISLKLVVAGNGTLTDEETALIEKNSDRIVLIKRYIQDEEMCWLFENAAFTVLPYVEASQSGVLSISYHFGKPVIVSNVDGLTEFVENERTGLIFKDEVELEHDLINMSMSAGQYKDAILSYYEQELDWSRNIKRCLEIR